MGEPRRKQELRHKEKPLRKGGKAYDHLKPLLIDLMVRCPRCHRSTTTKLFHYVSDPPAAEDGLSGGCEECHVYWRMAPEPLKDFDREEALGITRGIVHLFKKTKISPLLARLQDRPPTDEEVALLAAEVQRGRVADLTMPDRRAKRRQ
jgi:hypothetical protein